MSALSIISTAVLGEGGFDLFEWMPGVVVWTLIIFVLSLPLMIKFVFGPIVKALDERDRKVEDAAVAAEEARRTAEQAVAKAEEAREEARAEARQMVQAAQARAERQAQDAVEAAKAEADRQMEKARQEIEAAKRRALVEIRQEVVALTIASTGKILRRDVDDEAHRRLVDDFIGVKDLPRTTA